MSVGGDRERKAAGTVTDMQVPAQLARVCLISPVSSRFLNPNSGRQGRNESSAGEMRERSCFVKGFDCVTDRGPGF